VKHIYFCTSHPAFSETFVATEMQSMVDRGEDVLVYSLRKPPRELSPSVPYLRRPCSRAALALWSVAGLWLLLTNIAAGLRFHPRNAMRLLVAASHAARVAKTIRRPDERKVGGVVLHAHFLDRPADVVAMLRSVGTAKFVTVHAGDAYVESDRALRNWRVQSFDKVICASDYVRRGLPERDSDIDVIHCGVAVPADLERRITRPLTRVRVCTVARLIPTKNHPYAAAVLEELTARGISVEWHVVGGGPMESWLDEFASATTHPGLRVVKHGAVAHEQALILMRAADVAVLPSKAQFPGTDGIPVALIEAMASGVLAVSTPVGGIPELIIDGVTGVLGDPLDPKGCAAAIAVLLGDPRRMQAILDNAFEHVRESFNARNSAAALASLTQLRGPENVPPQSVPR
jgi:colanic acid/amylovoran biosynthesis glycosyltransferase